MEPIKTVTPKVKDRKPLHVLQPTATDKENLVGADRILKSTKLKKAKTKQNITETAKKDASKKVTCKKNKAVQTAEKEVKIEAEDLISDNPSENYWQMLAEKRRTALLNILEENRKLVKDIEKLEEENCAYKEMLDETKLFVEVLQEQIENIRKDLHNSSDDSSLI